MAERLGRLAIVRLSLGVVFTLVATVEAQPPVYLSQLGSQGRGRLKSLYR